MIGLPTSFDEFVCSELSEPSSVLDENVLTPRNCRTVIGRLRKEDDLVRSLMERVKMIDKESRMAFDMLDTERYGYLNKERSRIWLRTRGCVLSDSDIDRFVLSRLKQPSQSNSLTHDQKFSLHDLSRMVDSVLANPGVLSFSADPISLGQALLKSAGLADSDKVGMMDLKEALTVHGDYPMSVKQFDTFVKQTGLPPNTAFINNLQLAAKIVSAIQGR